MPMTNVVHPSFCTSLKYWWKSFQNTAEVSQGLAELGLSKKYILENKQTKKNKLQLPDNLRKPSDIQCKLDSCYRSPV